MTLDVIRHLPPDQPTNLQPGPPDDTELDYLTSARASPADTSQMAPTARELSPIRPAAKTSDPPPRPPSPPREAC